MDSLENEYLQTLHNNEEIVSIYLLNGIRLQGLITGFDDNAIFLSGITKVMIYKDHIASILPGTQVQASSSSPPDSFNV